MAQLATKFKEQEIQNRAFDENTDTHKVRLLDSSGGDIDTFTNTDDLLVGYETNNIEVPSSTVTYICMENKDGEWCVKKIDTTSGVAFTYATVTNNPSVTTYASAYANRATLTYGTVNSAF